MMVCAFNLHVAEAEAEAGAQGRREAEKQRGRRTPVLEASLINIVSSRLGQPELHSWDPVLEKEGCVGQLIIGLCFLVLPSSYLRRRSSALDGADLSFPFTTH